MSRPAPEVKDHDEDYSAILVLPEHTVVVDISSCPPRVVPAVNRTVFFNKARKYVFMHESFDSNKRHFAFDYPRMTDISERVVRMSVMHGFKFTELSETAVVVEIPEKGRIVAFDESGEHMHVPGYTHKVTLLHKAGTYEMWVLDEKKLKVVIDDDEVRFIS